MRNMRQANLTKSTGRQQLISFDKLKKDCLIRTSCSDIKRWIEEAGQMRGGACSKHVRAYLSLGRGRAGCLKRCRKLECRWEFSTPSKSEIVWKIRLDCSNASFCGEVLTLVTYRDWGGCHSKIRFHGSDHHVYVMGSTRDDHELHRHDARLE